MPSETKNLKDEQKKPNANQVKEKIVKIFIYLERGPLTQKLFFIKNLQVMVKAGLPLSIAVKTLARQTPNRKLRRILLVVYK